MPQNRRSYEKTRRIALSGLLFALAMALSFIEGTLTICLLYTSPSPRDA